MEFIGEMMFSGSVKRGPSEPKAGSQGPAFNYSAPRCWSQHDFWTLKIFKIYIYIRLPWDLRIDPTFDDGTYMLSLLSLPACSLPMIFNSTRKQNYMMNFSRQHGLRHFYSRRRRSLRPHPWRIQVDSPSDVCHVSLPVLSETPLTASCIGRGLWRTRLTESPSGPSAHHCPTLWTNGESPLHVQCFMSVRLRELWPLVICGVSIKNKK